LYLSSICLLYIYCIYLLYLLYLSIYLLYPSIVYIYCTYLLYLLYLSTISTYLRYPSIVYIYCTYLLYLLYLSSICLLYLLHLSNIYPVFGRFSTIFNHFFGTARGGGNFGFCYTYRCSYFLNMFRKKRMVPVASAGNSLSRKRNFVILMVLYRPVPACTDLVNTGVFWKAPSNFGFCYTYRCSYLLNMFRKKRMVPLASAGNSLSRKRNFVILMVLYRPYRPVPTCTTCTNLKKTAQCTHTIIHTLVLFIITQKLLGVTFFIRHA